MYKIINLWLVIFILNLINVNANSKHNLKSLLSINQKNTENHTIVINEIMAMNDSVIADEYGEYDDWIEIYNNDDTPVDLQGLYISDDFLLPGKHRFTSKLIIPANGYLILWADNQTEQGINHLPFKLSGGGEKIGIFDPTTLQPIDSVTFALQRVDVSYGRSADNPAFWNFFSEATPKNSNLSFGYTNICQDPVFSMNGGFYAEDISLELYGRVGENIFYTTDGSDPDLNSNLYNEAICINSTTVIRAISYSDDCLKGQIVSQTYFFCSKPSLPVMAITTDENNLYGDKGIYSNPWSDGIEWERLANLQYFVDGKSMFSTNCGIRIQGGNSVGMPKKSFRLFFENSYGKERLEYPLFKDSRITSFKNLVLRAGYDDDITTYNGTLLRDPLSVEMWKKTSGLHSASDWVILYINDQYWGIYNLRESINEHFIEDHTYDSDFDLIRFMKYGEVLKYGSLDEWDAVSNFMKTKDLSSDIEYKKLCSIMDIEDFVNMLALIHCTQFRSWTWGAFCFKSKLENEKWRWSMWDTDRSYEDLFWNGFIEYANTDAEKWANFLPQKMLKNNHFRNSLINQTADLLNTIFLPKNSIYTFDSLAAIIKPEMSSELNRWNSTNNWENKLTQIKDFLDQRPDIVREQIKSYFSLSAKHKLTLNTESNGYIKLNSINVREFPWTGIYFSEIPVRLTAIPKSGYKFKGWSDASLENNQEVEITLMSDYNLVAIFELTEDINKPVINEINYNSTSNFDTGDWIELYNPSDTEINIGGWQFMDENDEHIFNIPAETIIKPKDYIILCETTDKFLTFYSSVKIVGNFDFGLNRESDELKLFNKNGELIDFVKYQNITPWPIGADNTGYTIKLNDVLSNNLIAENWSLSNQRGGTPGSDNSGYSIKIDNINNTNKIKIWPNPTKDNITISLNKKNQKALLKLYNLHGSLLKQLNIKDNTMINIKALLPGVYFIRILIEDKIFYKKLIKH